MANKKRLPRYGRASKPPTIRLTERDHRILEAIHSFDGVLGFSQIRRMFFTGKSQAEERLKLLYQNGYLNRPNREQRLRMPEMVYWLDRKGAEIIASLMGIPLLEMGWRREPRWFQVEHDLAVNNFRLDLIEACREDPDLSLDVWVSESEFWAYPDTIQYSHKGKEVWRKIRPDGYFLLSTPKHYLRYLLEIDRSTEDHPRFFRDKILPGKAYVNSDEYSDRFGHRSGRWLVVTTTERRLRNMLSQARQAETKGLFYFTTYDKLNPETILHAPIWRRADRKETVPMLFID